MSKTPLAASGALLKSEARKTHALDWQRWPIFYARIALGAAFLSGIASRFGLYGNNVGYGNFANFVKYTAEVNSFMPAYTIPSLAWSATAAELVLGVALIVGVWPRWVALGSAALLALFGITMAISFGIKSPLDYSVFSASAAAVLLALHEGRKHGHES
jgi:putative oxidoreductase